MTQDQSEGALSRPLTSHERFLEATSTLHAALRAALHITGHHDLLTAADAFADAVVRHSGGTPAGDVRDEALIGVLRDYADGLEAQARRLARDLAETPEAEMLKLSTPDQSPTPRRARAGSTSPPVIPPDAWVRLRRPFRFDEVELIDLRTAAGAGRGTATPVATTDALLARLDAVVGPGAWSVRFDPLGGDHAVTAKATVTIDGHDADATRDGFGQGPSLQAALEPLSAPRSASSASDAASTAKRPSPWTSTKPAPSSTPTHSGKRWSRPCRRPRAGPQTCSVREARLATLDVGANHEIRKKTASIPRPSFFRSAYQLSD